MLWNWYCFPDMSKHVVDLTLFLQICQNTIATCPYFRQCVKTRCTIDTIFANKNKRDIKQAFFVHMSKHAVDLFHFCYHVMPRGKLSIFYNYVKTGYKLKLFLRIYQHMPLNWHSFYIRVAARRYIYIWFLQVSPNTPINWHYVAPYVKTRFWMNIVN